MKRTLIDQLTQAVDTQVKILGWVSVRRDHGKLIFLDVRDSTATVQVVYQLSDQDKELIETLKPESVVEIIGQVKQRPERMVNPEMKTGTIELGAKKIHVINQAQTPPFEIHDKHTEAGEEVRMQYRYLDLRNERMQHNIRFRHRFIKALRDYLDARDFVEIETPILTKSSPEGARDFIVPSRLSEGSFYALPQAPQQFKQLLMVAGFERYYQIARCFRDEDLRLDRQPEFTQLDIEMSFVDQEAILTLCEDMFREVIRELLPEKKIPDSFQRLTYDEAMSKHGSDKPDLRSNKKDDDELAFAWVTDFPMFERDNTGKITFAHNPFARPRDEDLHLLDSDNPEDLLKVRAYCYDLVLNGVEISSGSLRIHDPALQHKIFTLMGLSDEQTKERFGAFMKAFTFGAPPHGGLAPGLDRLIMVLLKQDSIRDVIAFPKTGDMRDLMLGAPGKAASEHLRELGLQVRKQEK